MTAGAAASAAASASASAPAPAPAVAPSPAAHPALTSVEEIAQVILDASSPDRRILVGIVGPPGAGKSTVAASIVEMLTPAAVLLPMDGFHLPQATLVELGRRDRMGAPDTFDVDGFLATLDALRGNSGRPVLAPGFDRTIEEAVPGAVIIPPEFPIVVIEGNYLLLATDGWERVAPALDVTLFVTLDRDIRIRRLIARHVRFGKSADAARDWALGPDEANARLIGATAARADWVIALG